MHAEQTPRRSAQSAFLRVPLFSSAELNAKSLGQPDPGDLAFLAMAQQQLGQRDAARATFTRLRELMQKPPFKDNAEAQSFLREAETLIEGR